MTEMLICEKLFLLLTKDSGSFETSNSTYGLNGALLIDLLLAGRVALGEGRNPPAPALRSRPGQAPGREQARRPSVLVLSGARRNVNVPSQRERTFLPSFCG